MQQQQIRPGVVKRSNTVRRRQAHRRKVDNAQRVCWVVWYRFGNGAPVRATVRACPHEAQAECNKLKTLPAVRSWVKRTTTE